MVNARMAPWRSSWHLERVIVYSCDRQDGILTCVCLSTTAARGSLSSRPHRVLVSPVVAAIIHVYLLRPPRISGTDQLSAHD